MYHISIGPIEGNELRPSRPEYMAKEERDMLPRVCFAPTITQCLLAMPRQKLYLDGGKGALYIYRAEDTSSLVPAMAPDAAVSGEMVSYVPVRVKSSRIVLYMSIADLIKQMREIESDSTWAQLRQLYNCWNQW